MENSIAMNGGDGPNSYTQNSKLQGDGSDRAKVLLSRSIHEKLTISSSIQDCFVDDDTTTTNTRRRRPFCLADLGCSVGPNTFACVQTIIEQVKLKHKTHGIKLPEFHVFFNDHVANDFNTLFEALPIDREYMAAGVPGSFYGRLFPKGSIDFMHSAFALHWLTQVPDEIKTKGSPAWNKGRITYFGSSAQVVKAYTDRFTRDMEAFLSARSVEMVVDGLMAILIPCRPEGSPASESLLMLVIECLGYALTDMAKEGLVDEALVDSFNVPTFVPTGSEVKEVVLKNRHLSIEIMEETCYPLRLSTPEEVRVSSLQFRATTESVICKHFGPNLMVDEFFERYSQKLEQVSKDPRFTRNENFKFLFLLIKRV